MPGGARQLFDPESPPTVVAPEGSAAFDPALHRDTHPDVLSVGALYNEVDTALSRSFPRNRRLWVRGEIAKLSDHRSGHLYMDLVDPDEVRSAGPRGRGGIPTLNVKCWRTSWAPLRHSLEKEGIQLAEGMIVVLRGTIDLYRAKGEVSFVLAEVDVTALLGRMAAQRAQLLRALEAEGLLRRNAALPVPEPALHVGLVASPGPRATTTSSGASSSRVSVPHLLGQVSSRVPPRRPPSRGVCGSSAEASVTSSSWSAAAARRRISPRSTPSSWLEPWPASKPVFTGIGHTGDQSVADLVASRVCVTPTECGQHRACGTALVGVPRPGALGGPGAAHPPVPRRRAAA